MGKHIVQGRSGKNIRKHAIDETTVVCTKGGSSVKESQWIKDIWKQKGQNRAMWGQGRKTHQRLGRWLRWGTMGKNWGYH